MVGVCWQVSSLWFARATFELTHIYLYLIVKAPWGIHIRASAGLSNAHKAQACKKAFNSKNVILLYEDVISPLQGKHAAAATHVQFADSMRSHWLHMKCWRTTWTQEAYISRHKKIYAFLKSFQGRVATNKPAKIDGWMDGSSWSSVVDGKQENSILP